MRKFKRSLARVALPSAFMLAGLSAQAVSTDVTGVVNELSTLTDAAIVVGIVILVFMVGRKLVRRLI